MAVLFATPFVAAALLVISLYTCFASGFVLACLWAWFAVPLGLPLVGWKTFAIVCIGLRMMLPSHALNVKDNRDNGEKIASIIGWIIAPWFALLVGWCIK